MLLINLISKVKIRIWSIIIQHFKSKKIYHYFYKSYWHYIFHKIKSKNKNNYFTSKPNPGAGIGHQIANWIAGYWWAKQFELKFAHLPFSTNEWEEFLGFGDGEIMVTDLIKSGYKKVLLPLFDENELNCIKDIIASYGNKKVVFITEQDQGYNEQIGVIEDIKYKFHNSKSRKNDRLVYSKNNFNIALHVRRGDITIGQINKNPNLLIRWQNNDYFKNVLLNVLSNIKTNKTISIYLFSQGKRDEFKEFEQFNNLHFCLNMNPQDSFLHLVYADLLITSKSSFSYKPALLNKGIKICPKDFWHAYPKTEDWILADVYGNFNIQSLLRD